jgi:hypothetical protein
MSQELNIGCWPKEEIEALSDEEKSLVEAETEERESLLRSAGFELSNGIWKHSDGRAVGDSTIRAVGLAAMKRYLGQ